MRPSHLTPYEQINTPVLDGPVVIPILGPAKPAKITRIKTAPNGAEGPLKPMDQGSGIPGLSNTNLEPPE